MLRRHLYLRITAIVVGSLFAFSIIAMSLWGLFGLDRYEDDLYLRSAALAERLAPSVTSSPSEHSRVVSEVAEKLNAQISIYATDGALIASSSEPVPLAFTPDAAGEWQRDFGRTLWVTRLEDGRFISMKLNRSPLPDEPINFSIFLILLSLIVGILMYPFIRNVTRRIERLQSSVERIGSGALGARVKVEGQDEVAALARSFNASADQIERLVESQRLLLAHASHELRTPLSRIRLGIEFLQHQDDPTRRAALQRDIEELDSLIEELLLLSRLDAPNQAADVEMVDLLALAAIECANYPRCTLHPEQVSPITANGRMIQHLLRNLLDNAERHGSAPIDVNLMETDESVELIVSDQGPGIPEEIRARVFEPFYRGPGRQNVPGHGLGMALVKRIVDSQGGTIRLQNEPRSEVIVRFPKSASA